jgi:hypothetical protein
MSGTAASLGSVRESSRALLPLPRREAPVATRRHSPTGLLMAPACEVALPTLEKVPTEQRFSADDGELLTLAEILARSDMATVEDWQRSGRDAARYLSLTLERGPVSMEGPRLIDGLIWMSRSATDSLTMLISGDRKGRST